MKIKEWMVFVLVAAVVAVIASLITGNLTGMDIFSGGGNTETTFVINDVDWRIDSLKLDFNNRDWQVLNLTIKIPKAIFKKWKLTRNYHEYIGVNYPEIKNRINYQYNQYSGNYELKTTISVDKRVSGKTGFWLFQGFTSEKRLITEGAIWIDCTDDTSIAPTCRAYSGVATRDY